ncbi:SGNH/GDSL hydrolase family protein [Candidatus Kaiserbacteria bacterium]|nr:SGNH/GDSL hydrolase family protein [Candidatus Kaiserbacteria bacterium]
MSVLQTITLALLFALALYGVLTTVWILRHLNISRMMTASVRKFERIDPAAATKILFIGDSTGYGTGTSHSRYSVVGRLGADFPDAYIENNSKTGRYLSHAREVLREAVRAKGPGAYDLIIIMLGGIDLVHGRPLLRVGRTLKGVLADCRECGRKTVLVGPNNTGLAPLYLFPLSRFYQARARRFHILFRDLAHEEGIMFVPLFREDSDELSAGNLFSRDKTHPNDAGYGVWYDQMRGAVLLALAHDDGSFAL